MAAVFIMKDPAGKLCGILVLHVDDGLTCGEGKHYHAALEALKKRAPLNKWSKGEITFTGRNITQHPDKTTEVEQHEYLKGLKPIPVLPGRRHEAEADLTVQEQTGLRSHFGKLDTPRPPA